MASKRRGLGRGLDALLGSQQEAAKEEGVAATEAASEPRESLRQIPIEQLQRGKYQPRRDMHPEALEELATSIRNQGVMQPIVIRPIGQDRYEIIAGERRWRASQQAGLDTIPAVIRDVDDEAAIAMALIENIQREDLNAIEEAQALIRLQKEFNLTQQEVADAVGKSRAAVANLIRLDSLEDDVKRMLEHGDLDMGHGRALLALDGVEQAKLARTVAGKGMTVRQTEDLVRKVLQARENAAAEKKSTPTIDPDIRHLQEGLSDKVGAPVSIQHGASGKGKLVIRYNSLDELDGILAHIQ
ncbi:MAG: ParB/RepB/Spo0J family partition protein [bacterium]